MKSIIAPSGFEPLSQDIFNMNLSVPVSKIPDDWSKNEVFGASKTSGFCLTATLRGYGLDVSELAL